jgi:hypothetical protein
MSKIVIDEEFKNLIPPLTQDEYSDLEKKILQEGFDSQKYGSIITWNKVIIDGHNRYEICQKHGIDFVTKEISFKDRVSAKEWIIRNQFGRRNLSPFQRAELALQLKPIVQARAKENQRLSEGRGQKGHQNSDDLKPKVDTYKEVAKIAGVSHDTVHKVDVILKEGSEKVKKAVSSGEMSINRGYKETKKREDKPVETPDKQEEETRKEQKESLPSEPVDNLEDYSIPNITQYIETVKRFSCDINPLCFMQFRYKTLTKEQRRDLLEYISHAKKSLEIIETQIKTNI